MKFVTIYLSGGTIIEVGKCGGIEVVRGSYFGAISSISFLEPEPDIHIPYIRLDKIECITVEDSDEDRMGDRMGFKSPGGSVG